MVPKEAMYPRPSILGDNYSDLIMKPGEAVHIMPGILGMITIILMLPGEAVYTRPSILANIILYFQPNTVIKSQGITSLVERR